MRKLPPDKQVDFLQEVLERNVRAIVEHEDRVRIVPHVIDPQHVQLRAYVWHTDMGLVIGEQGATADAIRRIVWTAAKKTDQRVDIYFV